MSSNESDNLPEHNQEEHMHASGKPKMSPFGYFFRFIGWWFGLSGLYAMFSVCPFCGQQGCPVGMASAGTIGAFFALCMQDWRKLFAYIRSKVTRKKH